MTVLLAGSELKLTNTMDFESFFVCKHGFSFDFIRESFDFIREFDILCSKFMVSVSFNSDPARSTVTVFRGYRQQHRKICGFLIYIPRRVRGTKPRSIR